MSVALLVLAILSGNSALAQSSPSDLSFEVATVKPVPRDDAHPFNPRHFGAHIADTLASYWSMSPSFLLTYAYGLQSFQVTGPEWANEERYDIEAIFPEGVKKSQQNIMLRNLLRDRFKLAFHIEQRPLELYALVVAKQGAKLKPSLPDPVGPETGGEAKTDALAKSTVTKNPDGSTTYDMGKKGTMTGKFDFELHNQHIAYSKMTMEDLAGRLSYCFGDGGHRIVDETGLQGNYQVAYDCSLPRPRAPVSAAAMGVPSDPDGGSMLYKSLEALGLRLEKRKVPTDIYVIDHLEKPSEN